MAPTEFMELRALDRLQYTYRNLVERFFFRIKQFCGFATRYDYLVSGFSCRNRYGHQLGLAEAIVNKP